MSLMQKTFVTVSAAPPLCRVYYFADEGSNCREVSGHKAGI